MNKGEIDRESIWNASMYKEEEKLENSMKINTRLWITNGFCVTITIVRSKSIYRTQKPMNSIEVKLNEKRS